VLTSGEVREALERSGRRFVEACASATDRQWEFQPVEGRAWRMPQIVEHVTGANDGVLRLLQQTVVGSPRGDQVLAFDDEDMPYLFYGGGLAAPPGLDEPLGTLTDRRESLAGFERSVHSLVEWYSTLDVDLRSCALAHPAFGVFDGVQWLLFAAVHAQQHRGDVLDVQLECERAQAAASTR
jgi:hypothetical protein